MRWKNKIKKVWFSPIYFQNIHIFSTIAQSSTMRFYQLSPQTMNSVGLKTMCFSSEQNMFMLSCVDPCIHLNEQNCVPLGFFELVRTLINNKWCSFVCVCLPISSPLTDRSQFTTSDQWDDFLQNSRSRGTSPHLRPLPALWLDWLLDWSLFLQNK